MARRSPWMDDRAQFLVAVLADVHDMQITEDVAREDVSNHVDHVATSMRIGRQAAKHYVTEDVIRRMAARVAREVNRELTRQTLSPSAHLRVLPRFGND